MRKIDPLLPVGRRVYVGDAQGVEVPMREIPLEAPNPPVRLYDTSGPHGDPEVQVDLERGLSTQRLAWIHARNDVEELAGSSSDYRRLREGDANLAEIRFPDLRRPLRARPGNCVTQMHYAKRGEITPEM